MEATRYGRLTLVERAESKGSGARWLCLCDCGNQTIKVLRYLKAMTKRGVSPACGCTRRAARAANGRNNRTHGMSGRKLYDVWRQMHRRCNDPACKDYPAWGGRGIAVCDEWGSVGAFVAWAVSSGYADGLTIERTDNNAGYSPGNCRWIPNELQSSNTRRLRMVDAFGQTKRLDAWARDIGMNYRTLKGRLDRGWNAEDALTTPLGAARANRPAS